MRRGEVASRVLDVAVVGFAIWTVLYHLALLVDIPTTALLIVWLVALAAVVLLARRSWMATVAPATVAIQDRAKPLPVGIAVAAGAASAIAVVAGAWLLGLALAAAAIAGTALAAPWRSAGPDPARDGASRGRSAPGGASGGGSAAGGAPGGAAGGRFAAGGARGGAAGGLSGTGGGPDVPSPWADLAAVLVAAGFAVFSQFIVRPDGDDAYYVNRSVWVAQHGRIPVGDVLFVEHGPVMPGAAPVSSVEAFAGAVARVLHVNAASFVYYVLLPGATFLAVLALWRLVRAWAPRRAVLCLLLAAAFLLWSGASSASFGSFHLVRSWQGKAIFVSVAVPALYAYLSEWLRTRRRRSYLLAIAAGVAGVGLTSSATFVVPLVAAAVGVGLLIQYGLTRWSIRQILLAGMVALYPVAAGLAVAALIGSPAGEDTSFNPAETTWDWVVGPGPLTLLGGAALWLGPFLVRRGAAAALAWGTSAVALVLMIPGVLEALADATGSGPVLWRALWVAPVPALAGLLAAVPLPRPQAVRVPQWALACVPALAGVLVLVLAGTPVWAASNRAHLGSPQWKANTTNVGEAFAIVRAYPDAGVVLAPAGVMSAIPLVTSRTKAVNPRTLYLQSLTDGTAAARRLLSDVATQRGKAPSADQVLDSLKRTEVDVACLNRRNQAGLRLLQEAGFGGERRIGRSLNCLTSGVQSPLTPR
jgi:hypothetical protein